MAYFRFRAAGALTAISIIASAIMCCGQVPEAESQDRKSLVVGERVLPTGQVMQPAGELLEFPGRPNDLCYYDDGRLLFVKNHKQLLVVSVEDWSVQQALEVPGGSSLTGIVVDRAGQVYVSNATHLVHVFSIGETRGYELQRSLEMSAESFPCGMCFSPDQQSLFVCLSKKNALAVVDLTTKTVVKTIDVGIAPFDVEYLAGQPDRLFVSNLGGRRARPGDTTATSAGTETPVDVRGIANTSAVSVIDVASLAVIKELQTGLHPTDIAVLPSVAADGSNTGEKLVLVTNSNDDSVTWITANRLQPSTQLTKPLSDLPFGSMPSSAVATRDGQRLFVALAGNNAIAAYNLNGRQDVDEGLGEAIGMIPTAWYPVALAVSDKELFVANVKGSGSRAMVREPEGGRNSHDHQGMIQRISLSDIQDLTQLASWTEFVSEASKLLPLARAQETTADVEPRPMPERLGDPSTFQHVIYVIKENRTYDQVFGDMPEGRGEPKLCTFPEKNTPNHHALARRFGLLDNYYCNGVLSADGHSWATEANVTPYLERAFGGFARSYTFGDDPLTYSSSGFLWDHVLAAGLTFRNYGEMDYAKPPAGMNYQQIWQAYEQEKSIEFSQTIGIERLRRYSCRDYPGWSMTIPDVLRMDRFLKEFEQFKIDGTLPNLCIVYLPQDHLGGGVTSAAHMADNDLALGRLVEAVSHSEYWPKTLIIANEDDPQNGYDHIDGHRSICLVVSAYSRPGVNHTFYNQTSAIRSMLHVLGLPPMNQQDARSPLMRECFTEDADREPFVALPANFPLNQTAANVSKQSSLERRWRDILETVPIERTGMKSEVDEDNLNRFVWHEVHGWEVAYPADWVGAHGRGLKQLGLVTEDPVTEEPVTELPAGEGE